jgi:hypothetical protein
MGCKESLMAANDYQVGGTHYQQKPGVPQHWDLSIMYQWDGFQHCITKYIMRWKTKYHDRQKKLEDLKKALHMLEKYIENYESFLPEDPVFPGYDFSPPGKPFTEEELQKFFDPGVGERYYWKGQEVSQYDYRALTMRDYETQSPTYLHDNDFLCEGGYGDGTNLYRCRHCRKIFGAVGLEAAKAVHAGQCPNWQQNSAPDAYGAATAAAAAPGLAPAAAPDAPPG